MKSKVILKDNKFHNCFVAMKSFSSGTVVASGKDAESVRKEANEKGFKNPVIMFVPPKGAKFFY